MQRSSTIRDEVFEDLASRNPRVDIYQTIRDQSGDRYEDHLLTKEIADELGRDDENNILVYLNEMEDLGYLEHDVVPRENAMDAKEWRFSPSERRLLLGEETFTEKFHQLQAFAYPAIGGVIFGFVVLVLSVLMSVQIMLDLARTVFTVSAVVLGSVLYVAYTESAEFDLFGDES